MAATNDVEQMARILAMERVGGNIDSYGWLTGQNMYGYRQRSSDAKRTNIAYR